MLKLIKMWYFKVNHYFNPYKCGENNFWFYDVLFCSKCKRSLAFYTYEATDEATETYKRNNGEGIKILNARKCIKKFIIKEPFKNLFKDEN